MMRSNLRTILVFLFLGPLIGFLTLHLIVILLHPDGILAALQSFKVGEWAGVLVLSYVVGTPPAALSALAVILIRMGRLSPKGLYVFLVGALVGVTYAVLWPLVLWLLHLESESDWPHHRSFLILIAICLCSTLGCWAVSQHLDRSARFDSR
jgi:hypothetical protein